MIIGLLKGSIMRLSVLILGLICFVQSAIGTSATVGELSKIVAIQQAHIAKLTASVEALKTQSTTSKDELDKKITACDQKASAANERVSAVISGREYVSVLKFTGGSGDASITYDSGISITAPGGSTNGYLIVHPKSVTYWRQGPEQAKTISSWP